MIDGCSRFETFWRITLPLLLRALPRRWSSSSCSLDEYLLASIPPLRTPRRFPSLCECHQAKAISWGLASAAGVLMSLRSSSSFSSCRSIWCAG